MNYWCVVTAGRWLGGEWKDCGAWLGRLVRSLGWVYARHEVLVLKSERSRWNNHL